MLFPAWPVAKESSNAVLRVIVEPTDSGAFLACRRVAAAIAAAWTRLEPLFSADEGGRAQGPTPIYPSSDRYPAELATSSRPIGLPSLDQAGVTRPRASRETLKPSSLPAARHSQCAGAGLSLAKCRWAAPPCCAGRQIEAWQTTRKRRAHRAARRSSYVGAACERARDSACVGAIRGWRRRSRNPVLQREHLRGCHARER